MTQTAPQQAPGLGSTQDEHLDALGNYRFGWHDSDTAGSTAKRGIEREERLGHVSSSSLPSSSGPSVMGPSVTGPSVSGEPCPASAMEPLASPAAMRS